MIVHYVDSSAWVKYHVDEPGTAWMVKFLGGNPVVASSSLALIEVLAALARKQRAGGISARAHNDVRARVLEQWRSFGEVPFDDAIMQRSIPLSLTYALRGADVVHLASAMHVRDAVASADDEIVFIASDEELKTAAGLARFHVLDPTTSPR